MRLALTLSPEQALAVLCEAPTAPGAHSPEHVLDAAEIVLAQWGVRFVRLGDRQWMWMWHEHGDWSPPFGSREEAIQDAVEQRMRPQEATTQVV